jgi:hypothetical protein
LIRAGRSFPCFSSFRSFRSFACFPALAAVLALAFAACKPSPVLVAERSAPVGQEFIRLYPDGKAEYGYAVVKENFKARGGYRYAHDTVFFLDESFKPHFPAGYLPIKQDVLYMDNGLHFKIRIDKLNAK